MTNYVAATVFLIATVLVARRARWQNFADAVLPLGLALVTLALVFRTPVVVGWVNANLPPTSGAVIRHSCLVLGALFVALWVRVALTGRRPLLGVFVPLGLAAVVLMVVAHAAAGPWSNDTFLQDQPGAKSGWMVLYWMAYYAIVATAFGSFGVSALSAAIEEGPKRGAFMICAAIGSGLGLVWIVNDAAMTLGNSGFITRRTIDIIVLAAALLICFGGVGHIIMHARRRRHRREVMQALYDHLTYAVAEARLPTEEPAAREYHQTIQVMDALSVLSRHADALDPERVSDLVGSASQDVNRAYQLELAIARRGMDENPEHPADWSDWLRDKDALVRLGRAFRDGTTPEERERLVYEVVGY